jgi:hypothetical protein
MVLWGKKTARPLTYCNKTANPAANFLSKDRAIFKADIWPARALVFKHYTDNQVYFNIKNPDNECFVLCFDIVTFLS